MHDDDAVVVAVVIVACSPVEFDGDGDDDDDDGDTATVDGTFGVDVFNAGADDADFAPIPWNAVCAFKARATCSL